MAGGSRLLARFNERDILFVVNFGPVESFYNGALKVEV
jgi:hypothetical protein